MRILIVDDDRHICESIEQALQFGWPEASVIIAHDGIEAIKQIKAEQPDIALIDLGLPVISGYEVVKKVREISDMPIIIISAQEEEQSIIKALSEGADDYLIKPFGQMEIVARLRAFTRRMMDDQSKNEIKYEKLTYLYNSNELFYNNNSVEITKLEGQILYELLLKKGGVVALGDLAETIYGKNPSGAEGNIRVYIFRLRKKIESGTDGEYTVGTRSGIGYFLKHNK